MELEHREAVEKVIDFLDLQHYRDSLIVNLPYGVRKVVELARALCTEPKLLLLDEPSSGLNVEETEDMAFWIQDIRNLLGITVLMVEHDMSLVSRGVRPRAGAELRPAHRHAARRARCRSHPEVDQRVPRRLSDDVRPSPPQGQQHRDLLRADHGHPRRVSFEVPQGGIVTILGANGAGKTTCSRPCRGVMDPQKGSVRVRGPRDPAAWTPTR